ncbi:MAG: ABC transporter substrate-binding protein [Hydrogenophilales bacterium 12-61-10]|nr:MAG: ABC transporter substrate-binding protein [Hydrogenophilales bacterium 12-61-10]OYX29829.1 MAG: ABC transporter substrate-binding protein [Hydrogenophilales bacterium 32-62-9]
MKIFNHGIFSILIGALALSGSLHAQDLLHVYGPGGPAPAMKEAAAAFEKQSGHKVEVTAGPTPKWIDQAKSNADVVFSGSETMMSDFVLALEGRVDAGEVRPLYLRPLAILVRPGNPKRIKGLKSLLVPGVKVLVVNGAGQNGVWEDMAGRKGDINTVKRLRSNIVGFAKNSAEARQQWIDTPDIDAWLIWNIWQVANPTLADSVKIEPEYAIYRDTGVVLTTQGKTKASAQQFIDFLASPAGARIFAKWGWNT